MNKGQLQTRTGELQQQFKQQVEEALVQLKEELERRKRREQQREDELQTMNQLKVKYRDLFNSEDHSTAHHTVTTAADLPTTRSALTHSEFLSSLELVLSQSPEQCSAYVQLTW